MSIRTVPLTPRKHSTHPAQGDVAVSFGEENDEKAYEAWEHGVVLVDRSHWGRLRVAGSDHLEFLHGQTTADIKKLQPGGGCWAVRSPSTCVGMYTAPLCCNTHELHTATVAA